MKTKKAGKWFVKHEGKVILLLTILGSTYLFSMFISPLTQGGFEHAQRVWMNWQGLNVGILAFTSSYLIFLAATYHEEAKRERLFLAAKAMLPHALSELTHYLKSCMSFLRGFTTDRVAKGYGQDNDFKIPLPEYYKEVFRNCIEFADEETGAYLAGITSRLQINNSRLRALSKNLQIEGSQGDEFEKIKNHMCDVAEIHAMVDNLFSYSRGQERDYERRWFTKDRVVSAFRAMGVSPDTHGGLVNNIDRKLEKKGMLYDQK